MKKTRQNITWLPREGQELILVDNVDFDYLITKDKLEGDDSVDDSLTKETEFRSTAVADCNVTELRANDVIQFERIWYLRVDRLFQHGKPAVLSNIPTGKAGKYKKDCEDNLNHEAPSCACTEPVTFS